ncbi:hypothetical protein RclHR1_00410007 [Rhizophagus clarus]|uniref:Uncharacterized protein n=1 Tax=Rhizophagus clarus TaxID=94130 RepID=A0A2Z6RW39_9GLOM|nr:hypothetical protein RclHR1_00410007 [Rhizophagus clarus]
MNPIVIVTSETTEDPLKPTNQCSIITNNSVKRSIAFLSEKLASITLPIGEFSLHLNSQENVIDDKLT